MIRRARLEDLMLIEELLLRAKRHSEYRTVKVEFERARHAMRNCISSPQGFAAVAEHEGVLTGCLLGVVTHYWFSTERFASDLGFYSQRRGDGMALLRMFKDWADGKHATLQLSQSTRKRSEGVRRMFAQIGCEPVGMLYVGERPISVPQALRRA